MSTVGHEHETIRVDNLKTALQAFLDRFGGGGSGGGGVSLNEPLFSINTAGLGTPSSSDVGIIWNGSAWVYGQTGLTQAAADLRYLKLAGGTMTGSINMKSALTADNIGTRTGSAVGLFGKLGYPESGTGNVGGIGFLYSRAQNGENDQLEGIYITADPTKDQYSSVGGLYITANEVKWKGTPLMNQSDADNRYLPLTAGSSKALTGSLYFSSRSKGIFVPYTVGASSVNIPLIHDNGTNLWIGATETLSAHHIGRTYISAGHDGSEGNPTIYVCVPNAANTGGTNYGVLHLGNYTDYVVTISTDQTITGVKTFTPQQNFTNGIKIGPYEIVADTENGGLHVKGGLYADTYVSALGQNSSGGSGGSTTLAGLLDVELTNPSNGQALVYNSSLNMWVNGEAGMNVSELTTYLSSRILTLKNGSTTLGIWNPTAAGAIDIASALTGYLPLTAGSSKALTGSLYFSSRSRGVFVPYTIDDAVVNIPLIYENGSNLWIGAEQTTATHHVGSTYISSGSGETYISRLINGTRTNCKVLDARNTYVSSGKGYINETEITTISGNAATASRLIGNGSYTVWGQTYWQNGVPQSVIGDIRMLPSGGNANSDSAKIEFRTLANNDEYVYGPYIQAIHVDNYGRKRLSVFQKSEADWTTEQTEVFTILPNGNVGIGTITPIEKLDVNGNIKTSIGNGAYIQIGGVRLVYDSANSALKVVGSDGTTAANFYATGGVSALGLSVSGGGGSSALTDLVDVAVTQPQAGQGLVYDTSLTTPKWVNKTLFTAMSYTNNTLSVTVSGVTKTVTIQAGTSTIAWGNITGKPTTIVGYGITDAKIQNGTILLGNNSITPLTEIPDLSDTYLPLTAGSSKKLTGSLYLNNYGMGVYVKDPAENYIPAFYQNSQNLWIGATQTAAVHHRGATYISAGHDGTAGYSTIYVCVPNADNNNGNNYGVLHLGNYADYVLKLTGGTMQNTNLVTNLNADLLDGVHLNGLFTSLTSTNDTNISVTIGGVTKSISGLFALRLKGVRVLKDNEYGDLDDLDGSEYSVITNYYNNPRWINGPFDSGNSYGGAVVFRGLDASLMGQLMWNAKHDDETAPTGLLWWRARANKGWYNDWHQIAFTDSNVASATKLAMARSLWGNSFDGTTDVVGNLILNNGIYVKCKTSDGTESISLGVNSSDQFFVGFGPAGKGCDTFVDGNNLSLRYGTSRTTGILLNASGNVGVGTSSPSYKLHVNGSAKVNDLWIGDIHITYDSTNGGLYIVGGLAASTYVSALGTNAGGAGGATALSELVDVAVTQPQAGQGLVYDTSLTTPKWVNKTLFTAMSYSGNTLSVTVSGVTKTATIQTGSGTVTSVGMSVPTGFKVSSGSSQTITSSGTFALTFASGYSLPTTAKQSNWDSAYSASHSHDNMTVLNGITSTNVSNWDMAYDMRHSHDNLTVLDGITSAKVTKWDACVNSGEVTTQLQNYAYISSGVIHIGDTSITPLTSDFGTFWGQSWQSGGTVSGNMSSVGDISFSASGKNIGGMLYFNTSSSQLRVASNSTVSTFTHDGSTITPKLYVNGEIGTNAGLWAGFAELYYSTPYIDFHYDNSTSDYTTRLIENQAGILSLLSPNVCGLMVGGYDGDYVQIGQIRIVYDYSNNALKVINSNNSAANLYATGGISALGMGAGVSSIDAMTFGYLTINNKISFSDNYEITVNAGDMYIGDSTSEQYVRLSDMCSWDGSNKWYITTNGNARFAKIYLDSSRYIYVSNGTLYYYNGTTSKAIALEN